MDDDERTTVLAIGDPHLKYNQPLINKQYVASVLNIARKLNPDAIVILGDILDTHETIKTPVFKIVTEELIYGLSQIAHTFVIVGNHDYIDSNQFLTDNHGYNSLKRWEDVTVVDYPLLVDVKDKQFLMCPYVPPGRFVEALDKLVSKGYTWDLVDCIFAHQEFRGCNYGKDPSVVGDQWDEDFPPVISGHIHEPSKIGKNVYYPGGSVQHTFSESPGKCVWLVEFRDEYEDEDMHFIIHKHSLGLKEKKVVRCHVSDIEEFDMELLESYHVRIEVYGDAAEIANFRKGKECAYLKKKGVSIVTDVTASKELLALSEKIAKDATSIAKMSYHTLFQSIVKTKNENIQREYDVLFATTPSSSSKKR